MDKQAVLKEFEKGEWVPDDYGDLRIEQEDGTCMVLAFYEHYIFVTRVRSEATPIYINYASIAHVAFGNTSFTIQRNNGYGYTVYTKYALSLRNPKNMASFFC